MSARLLGAAFEAEMGSTIRKLVLLKLVDACDDDGSRIFPAVSTIARAAECSERQVQRELKNFCESGLLALVGNETGGRSNTREYRLDLEALHEVARVGFVALWDRAAGRAGVENEAEKGDTASPFDDGKGDRDDTERVTGTTQKGDKLSHPTPYRPLNDPSIERERARANPKPATGPAPATSPDGDPAFQALVATFPGIDVPSRAFRAWTELDAAARQRAIDRVPAYLAELKACRRGSPHKLSTYLGERLFDQAADPKAKPPAMLALAPRTQAWWALFWLRRQRQENVRVMLEQAKANAAWGVAVAGVPSDEDEALFCKIERGSPAFRAWEASLAREGLRLNEFACGQWIWVPAEWPPGSTGGGR